MIELRDSSDVIRARLAARELVRDAGLGVMHQTRFATAVSELTRNALHYAQSGACELNDLSDAREIRVQAIVVDRGPGIVDLERALMDGYSTGGGLGTGLPGARRLVDVFNIATSETGTRVIVEIAARRRI